jgi:PhnB protein
MGRSLIPMLTVRNAAAALDFYGRAFGAIEQTRFETPSGQIVAEMTIGDESFFVVDENPDAFNLSPETLGGTSVRISFSVTDPDATAAQAMAEGAVEIFPVTDQPYGLRQGRVADPFGHHWLISKPLSQS